MKSQSLDHREVRSIFARELEIFLWEHKEAATLGITVTRMRPSELPRELFEYVPGSQFNGRPRFVINMDAGSVRNMTAQARHNYVQTAIRTCYAQLQAEDLHLSTTSNL
jgi:hypothetical protein